MGAQAEAPGRQAAAVVALTHSRFSRHTSSAARSMGTARRIRLRRQERERGDLLFGLLGAVVLFLGMLWGIHWLSEWLSEDPIRWLIAAALAVGWICVCAVIGLVGTLLTALLGR